MSVEVSVDPPKFKYGEMIRKFATAIREYKKPSIIAVIFIAFETLLECFIPFVMAQLIDTMGDYATVGDADGIILRTVLIYAAILVVLAMWYYRWSFFSQSSNWFFYKY